MGLRRSLERDLGDSLVEGLTLDLRNLKLERRRQPPPVGTREGTCTPWRATVDLRQVGELGERVLVPERDEDDAVVGEGGNGVADRHLLPATNGRGRDEDGRVLAVQRAGAPETAGRIDEGLEAYNNRTVISGMKYGCAGAGGGNAPSTGLGGCHNASGYRR